MQWLTHVIMMKTLKNHYNYTKSALHESIAAISYSVEISYSFNVLKNWIP